jgi:hypothetical protein
MLSLAELPFQIGAFIFAETSSNIAAVEASHRIRLETDKHRFAHWAKLRLSLWLAEHHPWPAAARAE